MNLSENIQFSYDKILRFLTRSHSGYIFAMADDYRFILQVNNHLVSDLHKRNISAAIVYLDGASDEPLMHQLRQKAAGNNVLLVANLYEIINDNEHGRASLSHLNFSREEIHDMGIPILFWADKNSISILSNYAPDLFSQRSLATIHITGQVEHPVEEAFEKEDWKEFVSSDKFKVIEANIETLKRRLQAAEEAGYLPARIADEIALPLAKEYAELGSKEKSEDVLSNYQFFIKEDNAGHLQQLAWIYYSLHNYTLAISYLQQANALLENADLLSTDWFRNNIDIADWLREYGKLSEAKRLLEKTQKKIEQNEDEYPKTTIKHIISLVTDRLGDIAQQSGNLQEAKRYYEQNLAISKDLIESNPHDEQLKRDLSVSYSKLGNIAQESGNLQEAKEYYEQDREITEYLMKSNPHSEQLKRDLAISFINIALLAEANLQHQEAITQFSTALQILQDLSVANPLSQILKNDISYTKEKIATLQNIQSPSN